MTLGFHPRDRGSTPRGGMLFFCPRSKAKTQSVCTSHDSPHSQFSNLTRGRAGPFVCLERAQQLEQLFGAAVWRVGWVGKRARNVRISDRIKVHGASISANITYNHTHTHFQGTIRTQSACLGHEKKSVLLKCPNGNLSPFFYAPNMRTCFSASIPLRRIVPIGGAM